MRSRRTLRILFALPIPLLLAAWLWSAFYTGGAGYQFASGLYGSLITNEGIVVLSFGSDETTLPIADPGKPGWNGVESHPFNPFLPIEPPTVAGFAYYEFVDSGRGSVVVIPYWFPLLLSSALLLLVWRKTRLKLTPQSAFPLSSTPQPPNPTP